MLMASTPATPSEETTNLIKSEMFVDDHDETMEINE